MSTGEATETGAEIPTNDMDHQKCARPDVEINLKEKKVKLDLDLPEWILLAITALLLGTFGKVML
jgi:hypothetical protein